MHVLRFPGTPLYAATADEIDAVAGDIIASQAKTVGLDLEWNFVSSNNGPVAVIQLCWPGASGELQAAVLHVAGVPGRMTAKLQALLEDAGVRKVVFGNYDQPRLADTYGEGCLLASLVDAQAVLRTRFPELLPPGRLFPTLANVVTWLLGWHISKELQKQNNCEGRRLSDPEILYGATDAYAHLMVWRSMLHLEAARAAAAAGAEAPPAGEGSQHKRKWAAHAGCSSEARAQGRQQHPEQQLPQMASKAASMPEHVLLAPGTATHWTEEEVALLPVLPDFCPPNGGGDDGTLGAAGPAPEEQQEEEEEDAQPPQPPHCCCSSSVSWQGRWNSGRWGRSSVPRSGGGMRFRRSSSGGK